VPPSKHEFGEIIHRLGNSRWRNAYRIPENLMQIIGIYKTYAVPMDFYCDLLYIAERVF